MRSRLVTLGRWAARVRTALFTLGGFGALTAAAWTTWGLGAGLAAGGASLLFVELLSDGGDQP